MKAIIIDFSFEISRKIFFFEILTKSMSAKINVHTCITSWLKIWLPQTPNHQLCFDTTKKGRYSATDAEQHP